MKRTKNTAKPVNTPAVTAINVITAATMPVVVDPASR
jgi:hypothetical protein